MEKPIKIIADFSGGLDLVFDNKPELTLELPANSKVSDVVLKL